VLSHVKYLGLVVNHLNHSVTQGQYRGINTHHKWKDRQFICQKAKITINDRHKIQRKQKIQQHQSLKPERCDVIGWVVPVLKVAPVLLN
jgi:hypothetical protein